MLCAHVQICCLAGAITLKWFLKSRIKALARVHTQCVQVVYALCTGNHRSIFPQFPPFQFRALGYIRPHDAQRTYPGPPRPPP